MSFNVQLIKGENQKTSLWSGGTTTELFISPKGAEYSNRSFNWRLSSAVVELEESTFTPLPGVDRHIMLIEGEMDLCHEGHHNIHLLPYEKDFFKGDWTSHSRGKVRDFNLMLKNGYRGSIEHIRIKGEAEYKLDNPGCKFENIYAFYCAEGQVLLTGNDNNSIKLDRGDVLIFHGIEEFIKVKIENLTKVTSNLIIANIYN